MCQWPSFNADPQIRAGPLPGLLHLHPTNFLFYSCIKGWKDRRAILHLVSIAPTSHKVGYVSKPFNRKRVNRKGKCFLETAPIQTVKVASVNLGRPQKKKGRPVSKKWTKVHCDTFIALSQYTSTLIWTFEWKLFVTSLLSLSLQFIPCLVANAL